MLIVHRNPVLDITLRTRRDPGQVRRLPAIPRILPSTRLVRDHQQHSEPVVQLLHSEGIPRASATATADRDRRPGSRPARTVARTDKHLRVQDDRDRHHLQRQPRSALHHLVRTHRGARKDPLRRLCGEGHQGVGACFPLWRDASQGSGKFSHVLSRTIWC